MLRAFWQRVASMLHARERAHLDRACAELARQDAEIARLRAENRALLNSILGIAGIPPIPVKTFTTPHPAISHSESPTHSSGGDESLSRPSSSPPQTDAPGDSSSRQSATRNDSSPSPPSSPSSSASPARPRSPGPLARRRRSWHQINRMLELESARKNEQQL